MSERNEAAACWRRGVMHAVEGLDIVLAHAPTSKRRAPEVVALIRSQLDALTAFARDTDPSTYRQAFRASEDRLELLRIALGMSVAPEVQSKRSAAE